MTDVFPSEIIHSEINDQPLLSETVSIHSGLKETWNTIENSHDGGVRSSELYRLIYQSNVDSFQLPNLGQVRGKAPARSDVLTDFRTAALFAACLCFCFLMFRLCIYVSDYLCRCACRLHQYPALYPLLVVVLKSKVGFWRRLDDNNKDCHLPWTETSAGGSSNSPWAASRILVPTLSSEAQG